MKTRILAVLILLILLSGCNPDSEDIAYPVGTITSSSTPAISPYNVPITKENIDELTLLNKWNVENILPFNVTNFWFSDNNYLALPIRNKSMDGIQAFRVADFSKQWFIQIDSFISTIEKDHVFVFLRGLHVFNEQGETIQYLANNDLCQEGEASHIVIIPESNLVVTGHQNYGDITNSYGTSRLLIWNIQQSTCKELVKEFPGRLQSLAVSKDGRYLSYSVLTSQINPQDDSLIANLTTKIYDLQENQEICNIKGGYGLFINFQDFLVYSPKDKEIFLANRTNCKIKKSYPTDLELMTLQVNPGEDIFMGSSDSSIGFWDLDTGEKIYNIALPSDQSYLALVNFSPDGKFLMTTQNDPSMNGQDQVMIWGIPKE
jgi:WD40 repeat protein